MVRVITQETFDEVVRENVEEFEMTPEEAVEDAVKQFEAQGVNLDNIKKAAMDVVPKDSMDNLKTAVDNLNEIVERVKWKGSEIAPCIELIIYESKKTLAHKVFAGKVGAYDVLVNILETDKGDDDITSLTLDALIELMDGNPDLLDGKGVKVINHYLTKQQNPEILQKILKWTKISCVKHEQNRQSLFDSDLVPRLKEIIYNKETPASVVKEACGVARALVLDDDIRVHFGSSHDHARALAVELLFALTEMLKDFRAERNVVGDVMLTMAALVVRNEFCAQVANAGGVKYIRDIFIAYPECEKINALAMRLLKGLGGNDEVKDKILDAEIAPLLLAAMFRHVDSARLCEVGCAAIAALCLRKPRNSNLFYDAGAPEAIIECMKRHPGDYNVQKQGCWAIRNIVSRNKDLSDGFLKLGAEDVLRAARKEAKLDYDAQTALGDLGIEDVL